LSPKAIQNSTKIPHPGDPNESSCGPVSRDSVISRDDE